MSRVSSVVGAVGGDGVGARCRTFNYCLTLQITVNNISDRPAAMLTILPHFASR